MLIGLLLALGCSVCYGTASVLQAAATRSVTAGSGSGVDAMLLLRAVRHWRYLAGLGLDAGGFLLQVVALRLVPIYVVAAALAASLAVTAVGAAWLLSARLAPAERTAVGVVCVGLAMLGLAAGPEGSRRGPAGLGWALVGLVAAILVAGAAAGRLGGRWRALVLGLGAGGGFGAVEVGVRLIDVTDPTRATFYTNPALYAVALGGAAGYLLLTSALGRGSVTTAVAGMVVGETIGPALVGVGWLGDRTRDGFGWMVVVGFAIAVAGTLALARFVKRRIQSRRKHLCRSRIPHEAGAHRSRELITSPRSGRGIDVVGSSSRTPRGPPWSEGVPPPRPRTHLSTVIARSVTCAGPRVAFPRQRGSARRAVIHPIRPESPTRFGT
ncbi:hypothetical protein [Mycobacterium sp. SM1]|uniref:hypothetical protein n=1 Tax=Mycobacterium sp. SM1 TaxID=2816243 RepID=UPI001F197ECC|nr:hypothetical protein [Mycobacterium sp. SM1]